jgi:hypothetical protein
MLISKNTTDILSLGIISIFFNVAYVAHGMGVNFDNIDAFGARISGSVGAAGFGAFSGDVILNLSSGEFSFFGSIEGGVLIGEGINIVGGITLLQNMPSNRSYRGAFKEVGIMGGDIIGINVEEFWGKINKNQNPEDVPNGSFFGAGASDPSFGLYGAVSYSFEVLTVDQQGYHWFSDFPGPLDVLYDIGDIIWNDILHLP